MMFLKSPETLFIGHFGLMGIFSKKYGSVTQKTIYQPLPPCYVSEKTNEQIPRKLRDRWKDGQALFYRTLPAEARDPIK